MNIIKIDMNVKNLIDRQQSENFPARLIEHHRIVSELACNLATALNSTGLKIDVETATLMACIHDIGKSVATNELSGAGNTHEELGGAIAEDFGIPASIAKTCSSHGSPTTDGLDIEEIVVSLADKLWKGHRNTEFERQAVSVFAKHLDKDDWEVFMKVDKIFEDCAESGLQRLESTRS